MATDARGHTAPASGETPRRQALNDLSLSINDVVRVANATARAQTVTDVVTAGHTWPRPLYVHRDDAPAGFELEYTTDGQAWRAVRSAPAIHDGTQNAAMKAGTLVTSTNSSGDGSITFPDPYPTGLLAATLSDATAPGALGAMFIKWTSATSDRTRITFRAYGSNGAALGAVSNLALSYIATGY